MNSSITIFWQVHIFLNYQYFRVEIPPDDPTPEPEIEDDDAELILEKVEEEMMAEYEEEDDEDILHIDDITRLYGQNMVRHRYHYYTFIIRI